MPRPVCVHLLPSLVESGDFAGGIAVVIDLLRATSTIVTALAAGMERVIPCGEVEEARQIAARLPSGTALLGGERGGVRIDGFDLGNSPAEYIPAIVRGKTLVFTTTNGTRALLRARGARRVVVAAFANINAVVHWLSHESGPIHILCAGTDGQVTLEDVLCAGFIVQGMQRAVAGIDLSDDSTGLALNLSETRGSHYDSYLSVLRESRGGRNLIEIGLDRDIEIAALWDVAVLVPELVCDPWEIRPARDHFPTGQRPIEPPRPPACLTSDP